MGFMSGLLGLDSEVPVGAQQGLTTPDYATEINGQQQRQNAIYRNQKRLGQTLEAQAAGQGPNPAAEMLKQAQAQNAMQAAGQFSANRGINAGLAARQAAGLQNQNNQQAAGQAALMGAQQQLAAQQQLQNLYGTQGNQALQGLQNYLGSQQGFNQAINQQNSINAGVAAGNQQQAGQLVGGLLGGAGSAMGMKMASGGEVPAASTNSDPSKPKSQAGAFLSGFGKGSSGHADSMGALQSFMGLGRHQGGAIPMKQGGHVPGKASVKGDSMKNDTVPAMLSPGEIVIPRTIAQSKNAPDAAAKFVAAVLGHKSMGKKK